MKVSWYICAQKIKNLLTERNPIFKGISDQENFSFISPPPFIQEIGSEFFGELATSIGGHLVFFQKNLWDWEWRWWLKCSCTQMCQQKTREIDWSFLCLQQFDKIFGLSKQWFFVMILKLFRRTLIENIQWEWKVNEVTLALKKSDLVQMQNYLFVQIWGTNLNRHSF